VLTRVSRVQKGEIMLALERLLYNLIKLQNVILMNVKIVEASMKMMIGESQHQAEDMIIVMMIIVEAVKRDVMKVMRIE
jgi:hypothetical protein